MKLTASKDGASRLFSAKLGWKEAFDPKEIEMLAAGAVPMLIPPEAVQGRKNNVITYNISAYSTLEFYLSCILSKEQFAELLLQCIDLFRQMRCVYLNYKNLVLDFDQVYILLADRSVHFIYLPLVNSKREASIPDFFRKLIQKASRSTYEQVSFLESCLAWLDRPASFTLEEFETFIRGGQQDPEPQAAPVRPESHPQPKQEDRVYHPPVAAPAAWTPPVPVQGGTTPLAQPVGGTVVLAEEQPPAPPTPRFYLTRVSTGERVEITSSPFLVGTEAGSVAYFVSGNGAVSRRHAEFSIADGCCAVMDRKSTNKTYVNDCALTPFVPQPLADGDRLRLANENFTFSQEE